MTRTGEPDQPQPAVATESLVVDKLARQLGAAERRQVTVLFCDIVDSTTLGQHFDPEVIGALLMEYRRAVAEVVTGLGGTIVRYVGDGVLAVWGYPCCAPEDCRKATAAALDIIARQPHGIAVRAAIDVGMVVVGDIGVSAHGEAEIVGQAPNRAARMQAFAPANAVVVSDAVRLLLAATYQLERLEEPRLAQLVPGGGWIVRERRIATRRPVTPLPEIVGRAAERALLGGLWREPGAPRVVSITGEAGMGKSALVTWTLDRAVASGADAILVDCLPEQRQATLYGARILLSALLDRLEPAGAPIAERLAALFSSATEVDPETTDLMRRILDPEACGRFVDGARDREPDQAGGPALGRLAELFAIVLAKLGANRPLLLVIEDVHWCDEVSLRLFKALIAHLSRQHNEIRVIVTRRTGSGFPADVALCAGQHHICVGRLLEEEIIAIVAPLLAASGRQSSDAVLIAERAEGCPLLAVELARLRAELPAARAQTGRNVTRDILTKPSALYAVLCMRLDDLGPDKPLVQAAAILGRQFDARILADMLEIDRDVIAREMKHLFAAGVVVPSGGEAENEWRFSHGLLRQVAYGTLLKETRERLHGRAVDVLTGNFPDIAELNPEMIAEHATEARRFGQAFHWWHKAVVRAIAMSATLAAIRHGERALSVRALADEPGLAAEEIDLLKLLAPLLTAHYGNASPRVRATYQRCIALADALPEVAPKLTFELVWGLQTCSIAAGRIEEAKSAGDRLVAMAAAMDSPGARVLAHRVRGLSRLLAGELEAASSDFAVVHATYDAERHERLRRRVGADQGALALAQDALAQTIAGREQAARQLGREALRHAAALAHPHTSAQVSCFLASRAQMVGDLQTARALAAGALALGRTHRFPYWTAWASIIVGWLEGQGAPQRGIEAIRKGIEVYLETGAEMILPYARLLLADLLLEVDRPTAASAIVSEALRRTSRGGTTLWTAPLLHTLGRAAAAMGDGAHAMRLDAEAVAIVERQGSELFRPPIRPAHRYAAARGLPLSINALASQAFSLIGHRQGSLPQAT